MNLTIDVSVIDGEWSAEVLDADRTTGEKPRYVNARTIKAGSESLLFRRVRAEVVDELERRARN